MLMVLILIFSIYLGLAFIQPEKHELEIYKVPSDDLQTYRLTPADLQIYWR